MQAKPGQRYIPPASEWQKPLERMFHNQYKNETVDVDGKEFVECSFEGVTMRYQGERPFRITGCTFNSTPQITTDNPVVGQAGLLFGAVGALKPGADRVVFSTEPSI